MIDCILALCNTKFHGKKIIYIYPNKMSNQDIDALNIDSINAYFEKWKADIETSIKCNSSGVSDVLGEI